MAKPRVVSSSSARAGTRTVTVLRSLSLPADAGASRPRHTSPRPINGTVRPDCRRSRTARRRPRPQGGARRSLTSRGGVGRQPAAHSGWHRPLLRRAPTEASPFPEPLQQRCGPVPMTAPLRCPSVRERNKQQTSPAMHANGPSISSGAWRSHGDDVQPAPSSVRRTTRRRQRDRGPSSGLRVPRGCRRARAAVRNCVRCHRRHRARHGKDAGVGVKCTCRRCRCRCQADMSKMQVSVSSIHGKMQVSVSSVHVEDTGVSVECRRPMGRCSGPRDARWLKSRAQILETGHGLMLT